MRFDMTGFVPLFFISVISGLTADPPSVCAPSRLVSLALIARLPNCGVSRRANGQPSMGADWWNGDTQERCTYIDGFRRLLLHRHPQLYKFQPLSAWDGVYVYVPCHSLLFRRLSSRCILMLWSRMSALPSSLRTMSAAASPIGRNMLSSLS